LAPLRIAHDQNAASGQLLRHARDNRQPLSRIGVDRDQGDVGLRLHHDVGEEFVSRALCFEPDDVDSQQQVLESGTRRVVRIDDRKSANTFHQTDAFAGPLGVVLSSCIERPLCSGR
jgi:hypothetical protein